MVYDGRTKDDTLILGSNKDSNIYVVDQNSGSLLYTFKNGSPNDVVSVPDCDGFIGTEATKLALHLYQWSKESPAFKCPVAEKLGPVCVFDVYLFAGAKSGKIYVWEIATGELLRVWDAHYKAVSALVLSTDGFYLISAGQDSVLHVWAIMDVLDQTRHPNHQTSGRLEPFRSWTDHLLPITDLSVGVGGRVISCSLDSSCKIWDIPSGERLFSIQCPSALSCLVMDRIEHHVYLGGTDGKIYTLNLNAAASVTSAPNALIASCSLNDQSWTTSSEPLADKNALFEGHGKPITALSCTECGRYLISGCEAGAVRVWDTYSRQSLRSIDFVQGPVTVLRLIPRPTNLRAVVQKCAFPFVPLKKYLQQS